MGLLKRIFSPEGLGASKISQIQLSASYFTKQRRENDESFVFQVIAERRGPSEDFSVFIEKNQ